MVWVCDPKTWPKIKSTCKLHFFFQVTKVTVLYLANSRTANISLWVYMLIWKCKIWQYCKWIPKVKKACISKNRIILSFFLNVFFFFLETMSWELTLSWKQGIKQHQTLGLNLLVNIVSTKKCYPTVDGSYSVFKCLISPWAFLQF